MKITGFDIRAIAIPLEQKVKWANISETANEMLMLRIETDSGVFGLAQKKVHSVWTGMSRDMVALDLRDVYQPMLAGIDPLRSERVWAQINRIGGWSPTKTMLDIALHDLRARAAGLPVWKYLGGWSDTVDVHGFIARGSIPERLEKMTRQIESFGFGGFKIKIGTDESGDCEFLKEVRREFGDDLVMRVDANSGYTMDEAIRVSRRLADLGVQDFEDPCPLLGRNVRQTLYRSSPVPIVVDHVINGIEAARTVLEEGALRLALKVSRLGYRQSLEIMAECRKFGAKVVAGSLTECSLGALGALHFHAAHEDFAWCGAEDSYFATLSDDVTDIPEIRDGKVCLGDTPGLCTDWNPEKLEQYAVPLTGFGNA